MQYSILVTGSASRFVKNRNFFQYACQWLVTKAIMDKPKDNISEWRTKVLIGVIFGEKGTGKTKHLLQHANEMAMKAKGSLVFIDGDNSYMFDLSSSIRFINAADYGIDSGKMLYGFICGIAAQDFDLEYVYVDGFKNFVQYELYELEPFFKDLSAFSEKHNINIILSISGNKDSLPAFMNGMVLKTTY